MHKAKSSFVLAAVVFAGCTGVSRAEQSPAGHLLNSLQEITGVPGMSAAVSLDSEIIWTGAAGMADVERAVEITDQTKFRLASVSKLFTAALVLKLSEQGFFDLDVNIGTYVPEWSAHSDAKITLRQLAAHISGLDHYSSADRFDPSRSYRDLTDSLSIYGHKSLLFSPGDSYSYSSYGYALMGAAVEAVAGQSFDDAMEDLIVDPLALHNTFVENAASIPLNTTALYSIGRQSEPLEINRNDQRHVRGATGMLSTPSDLLRFANAYSSGAIVSHELRNMSWESAKLNDGSNAGETRYDVGFGWRIGRDWDGRAVVHHAGVTPGARSILSINNDTGTAVALLSNASWTSRIETTGELIATAATEGAHLDSSDCPEGAWIYEGIFIQGENVVTDTSNARGRIHISFAGNICQGELQPKGALAGWLDDRGARTSTMKLTLVARRKNNTHIVAMASPWGAFPLRFTDMSDNPEALGDIAGRSVALKLSPL